jgi:hypothetical protein
MQVKSMEQQRRQRLEDALTRQKLNSALLNDLLTWLISAEINLNAAGQKPIPDNIPIIEQLLQDHQVLI